MSLEFEEENICNQNTVKINKMILNQNNVMQRIYNLYYRHC